MLVAKSVCFCTSLSWYCKSVAFCPIFASAKIDNRFSHFTLDCVGDNSGGIDGFGGNEALAGINAGDGANSTTIPGSLTPSIINITQTSNVDIPGMWILKSGQGGLHKVKFAVYLNQNRIATHTLTYSHMYTHT